MPATYEPIATTTLGSAASEINFTSIPGTYTDLRLVVFIFDTSSTAQDLYRFNGDTANNYSETWILGDGSAAASSRTTNFPYFKLTRVSNLSSTPMLHTYDIFSYAGSTNKTVLGTSSDDQNGSGGVVRSVGLWRNTAAITSIKIYASAGPFSTGTTATLYGILKA